MKIRFNVLQSWKAAWAAVNVIAGREDDVFADGYIYDGEHDAVKASYGSKVYVCGAFGKLTSLNDDEFLVTQRFWNAEIGTATGRSLCKRKSWYQRQTGYFDGVNDSGNDRDNGIFYAGLNFKLTTI